MSKHAFKVLNTFDKYGRSGIVNTRAGSFKTPSFMPVGTKGAVKGLLPEQVKATGAEIILGNTYHLHLAPGEATVKKLGGLHKFTGWEGPILTDSGGFQVFSLAHSRKITEEGVHFSDPKTGDKVFISPEKSIQIQLELGSDIIMAFDDLTGLDESAKLRTTEAVERTHRWLQRCTTEFARLTKNMSPIQRPLLFGIVQGGLNKELRKKSLEFVSSQAVDGVAIGGLSVGESRADMHKMLEFLAPMYDNKRPRYLMGVGDPTDFRFAIEQGIDMMDCVLPTRNARHATVWVHSGCTTSSCQQAKPAALKKLAGHSRVEHSGAPSEYSGYTSVRSSSSPSSATACTSCGESFDKKIHLTNEKYKDDPSPIDENCDCYTCKAGFSKGFLRHQFKSGESLAGSLASIHNIRYLNRIAEGYQSSSFS